MRILLIADEISRTDAIRTFGGVWSYYLPRALKSLGVEVGFTPFLRPDKHTPAELVEHFRALDISRYDHVLALGLRYFDHAPQDCGRLLRERAKGAVAQIYDGGMLDSVPVDLTFTFRNDDWQYPIDAPNNRYARHHRHNKYVGWAADGELCRPEQDPDELRILIDHAAFNPAQSDQSLHVLLNVRELVRSGAWRSRFKAVRIRRLVDGGVEDCDLDDIVVRPYNRRGIPYTEACAEYSRAHLFMVTHRETVGLTVLETAMAGALPVVPEGYVPQDRLDTVRHATYRAAIDWAAVMRCIDAPASRAKALANNWTATARRIVDHLRGFEKGRQAAL